MTGSTNLTWAFVATCTLGTLQLPLALLGFFAAIREDVDRLRLFCYMAAPLAGLLSVVALYVLVVGDSAIDDFVAHDCRSLVQQVPADWLTSFAPGLGCTKYYGRALNLRSNSSRTVALPLAVGSTTNCFHESHRTFAWEYAAAGGCGASNVYGCLDETGCCTALRKAMSRYDLALALVMICNVVALVAGAPRHAFEPALDWPI